MNQLLSNLVKDNSEILQTISNHQNLGNAVRIMLFDLLEDSKEAQDIVKEFPNDMDLGAKIEKIKISQGISYKQI